MLKALEKNPDDRYQTAGELAEDLRRHLRREPVVAARPGLLRRSLYWMQRRRRAAQGVAAALVVTFVLLAVGLLALFEDGQTARRETQQVEEEKHAAGNREGRGRQTARRAEQRRRETQARRLIAEGALEAHRDPALAVALIQAGRALPLNEGRRRAVGCRRRTP